MKKNIKAFVKKFFGGIILAALVVTGSTYAIDVGTQILREDVTMCEKLSATLEREEHRYVTQCKYMDNLNKNPFKYLSVRTVISYVNRITREVLAEVVVVMRFKYNEKTRQAECLSTASSSMTKDSEYNIGVATRRADNKTDLGNGFLDVEFKYCREIRDKIDRRYRCNCVGNIEVIDS